MLYAQLSTVSNKVVAVIDSERQPCFTHLAHFHSSGKNASRNGTIKNQTEGVRYKIRAFT